MSPKAKKITGWVLSILLGLLFLMTAFMKLTMGEDGTKMAATMGLTISAVKMLGVVELLCVLLFLIPRTGIVGTLLMAAYLGGAIATNLEHGSPFYGPAIVECIVWIAAVLRFPELGKRLMGNMG